MKIDTEKLPLLLVPPAMYLCAVIVGKIDRRRVERDVEMEPFPIVVKPIPWPPIVAGFVGVLWFVGGIWGGIYFRSYQGAIICLAASLWIFYNTANWIAQRISMDSEGFEYFSYGKSVRVSWDDVQNYRISVSTIYIRVTGELMEIRVSTLFSRVNRFVKMLRISRQKNRA